MKKNCLRWLSLALISGLPVLGLAQNGVVRAKELGNNVENDFRRVIHSGNNQYTVLLFGRNAPTSILVTYDTAFNVLWQNNIGPLMIDIAATSDGGVVAAGETGDQVRIVKVDAAGVTQWTKTYGGSGVDHGMVVRQKPNGNYLVLAKTSSPDGDILNKTTTDFDLWLLELDGAGNLVNQKLLGGTNYESTNGSLEFTPDGGLMVAAGTYSNDGGITGHHGGEDIWIVKLDAAYNMQWNRCIGGSGDEFTNSIYRDEANDYIVTGSTNSTNGDINGSGTHTDGFVTKLDPNGNIKWLRVIQGTYFDEVATARPLPGGDIVLTGYTMSDILFGVPRPAGFNFSDGFLLRYNSDGHMLWGRRIGGSSDDRGFDVLMRDNGNFIVTGFKWFNSHDGDFTGVTPSVGETRAFILEMRNLNVIKGIVFYDDNNNGIKEAGELTYSESPVYTNKGSYQLNNTPVDGNFTLAVDSGAYVTRLDASSINGGQYRFTPKKKNTYFAGSGQKDSFAIRIVPAALVEDLEILVFQKSAAYLDHAVTYQVRVSNLGGRTVTNPAVKLVPDNKVSFHSSPRGLPTVVGDTLIWQIPDLPASESDTFDVTFFTKTIPDIQPGAISQMVAVAEPYAADFDTLDNKTSIETIIAGQNSAITNLSFSIASWDSARINRTIPYHIYYNFTSQLDSTKGIIRFVKNSNTELVSAIPVPTSIVDDTLMWNFKDLAYGGTDTIILNLKTIEGGGLAPGDHIHFTGQLNLLTADTAELVRNFLLVKKVIGSYVEPDTITTTLPPPHGIRWTRSFGGTNVEYAYDVAALPDSGFIAIGYTSSTNFDMTGNIDSSTRAFIGRFDKDGHVIWKRIFGDTHVELRSVTEASPGIFYAAGTIYSSNVQKGYVAKFNADGDTLWTRAYGGSKESGMSVLGADDGGVYFLGTAGSSEGDVHDWETPPTGDSYPINLWLVKLDAAGTPQWDSCYFGQSHTYMGLDMRRTKDNKIIIGGEAIAPDGSGHSYSAFLLLLNNDGTRVMEKVYSMPGSRKQIRSIAVNDDNSFTIAGLAGDQFRTTDTSYSGIHGTIDLWMARIDNAGNILWEKYFGGTNWDVAYRLVLASDGNYLVAGSTTSNDGNATGNHSANADAWLLKIDPTGKLLWQKTVGGTSNDEFLSMAELADKSILGAGYTGSNDGDITGFHGDYADILFTKFGISNYITGTIYIDLNNNGVKDVDEPLFSSGVVKATSSTRQHSAMVVDGKYQMSVDTGNYAVNYQIVDSAYFDIMPASTNIIFDELSQTATADFRLVKKGDINDLRLDILPINVVRPGFTVFYQVNYENKGTVASGPVTIRIKRDPKTIYLESSIPYTSVEGDTLVWVVPALDIFESGSFNLSFTVLPPPTTNNGDSLRLYGEILPIANDSTPENNISIVRQIVQGSYDPNDKIEVHGNTLPLNVIENEEYLTYVIRFQNTGTDTAFNVYVRDTLSDKFDWNTFEMIDASHPYELSVQNGNTMEWYFRDIYLPDSFVNEPASHGFIAFRIKPRSDLAIGDSVENDAGIYFDFNLPVQTNLMLSTIGPAAALPSTILQFSAAWKQQTSVELKWFVVNESKVAHYMVEHSENGIQFNAVGQVAATNETGAHIYEFIHGSPVTGINYYRLKTVDIDGKIAYSKTITLKKDGELITSLKIYPVPAAKGPITVSFEGRVKGVGTLAIYNMDGTLVHAKQLGNIDQQNYRITIDSNTLNNGVYILHCTIGDKLYLGKLIVQ